MKAYPKPRARKSTISEGQLPAEKGEKSIRFVKPAPARQEVPSEAFDLSDTIKCIEEAMRLLKQIFPNHITKSTTQQERDFGRLLIQSQLTMLKTWLRFAKQKLAREYLAP